METQHPMRTVTPTLDGPVLAVLARGDAEFTGRQVQRMAGAKSHSAVRRVLARLVEQGVVRQRGAGNAYLYRLNRDHLAAGPIIALAGIRVTLFERLRADVAEWQIAPVAASVFGSVALGEESPRSDLDILIVRPAAVDVDDELWRSQLAGFAERVSAWTGNDARILEYGREELAGSWHEMVIQDVLRDGIEIAGSLRTLEAEVRRR